MREDYRRWLSRAIEFAKELNGDSDYEDEIGYQMPFTRIISVLNDETILIRLDGTGTRVTEVFKGSASAVRFMEECSTCGKIHYKYAVIPPWDAERVLAKNKDKIYDADYEAEKWIKGR